MTIQEDYHRAIGLVRIASQHAANRHLDTARKVLAAAHRDGKLDLPAHLAGRLQYDVVAAQIALLSTRNTTQAAASLRKILREAKRLQGQDLEGVLQWCEYLMQSLPHVAEIQAALTQAESLYPQFEYVAAFKQLAVARAGLKRDADLTPRTVAKRVEDVGTAVMNHLLTQNNQKQVMAIMRDLRKRRLVE